ncbi:Alpha/beta hydrolase fold-1 [Nemania sp. NC0429]|nr:Alpha/beta hydrolase fold-1 [Nemania sp. NC0429]
MDSEPKPVIILVHGAWHSPEVWTQVKVRLEAAGFEVYTPRLLTVVGPEPTDHTWRADVAVVHDIAVPLFRQGREVVIVGHSYGGVVITASVDGQTVAERKSRGLKGGFSAVVYICAFAIAQRGLSLTSVLGGKYLDWMITAEPFKNVPFSIQLVPGQDPFYNDLPVDEASKWRAMLRCHSQKSFEEPLEFCANDIQIPMTYLLCDEDQAMPIQVQESMVAAVPRLKTRRCTAAHSPFLSQPDLTADVIADAARKI